MKLSWNSKRIGFRELPDCGTCSRNTGRSPRVRQALPPPLCTSGCSPVASLTSADCASQLEVASMLLASEVEVCLVGPSPHQVGSDLISGRECQKWIEWLSSEELFGWSVGKTLPSVCHKCESRAGENDLGVSVSFKVGCGFVCVFVLFIWGKFSIFFTVKCNLWWKF